MKIAPREVSAFLASPPARSVAALFYGPDTGLSRERSKVLVTALLGPAPDAMAVLDVSEARLLADSALLADELAAVSLMADKRVILIRDAGDKTTALLESSADLLRSDVYVIVLAGDLGKKSSLRLWFEKAEHVAAIACYHDEARDIGAMIRDYFSKHGITPAPEVVPYLVGQLGNDRYVTRQELEKICIYVGEAGLLSLEDARRLVHDNRETEMDEAVNALADRQMAALDKALVALAREGVAGVAYLRALARYFQRLYAIRLQAEGGSVEQAIAAQRPPVFFKQVPHLTRHVRQWEPEAIAHALSLISHAELLCKTSDIPAFPASERELLKVAANTPRPAA